MPYGAGAGNDQDGGDETETEEAAFLKEEARALREELRQIEKRLRDLEQKESEEED